VSALRSAVVRRLPLLAALGIGYLAGWYLVSAWPEAISPQHPLAYSANTVIRPLAILLEVEAGRQPAAATGNAAEVLEESLDELVAGLAEGDPEGASATALRTRSEVVALVAAYRRVFPTFRPRAERVTSRLAAAPPPSPALLRSSGPALRRVLEGGDGAGLAALWASLQGRGRLPEIELSRDPYRLLVRLEDRGIPGRLRVYGDGRVVTTGPGAEPARGELWLDDREVRRLVADLVRGGLLAPDLSHEWRHRGAGGCRWLAPRPRGMITLTAWEPPPEVRVTLAVDGVRLAGSAAAVRGLERTVAVPDAFLGDECAPDEPVVARLRAAVAALRGMADAAPVTGGGSGPGGEHEALPGLAVLYASFTGDRRDGIWITDGRSAGRVSPLSPLAGFQATRDGGLIAFRDRADLVLLDRRKGRRARRLGPPEWHGTTALWSPDERSLLLGGGSFEGPARMLLGGARGHRLEPFGEPGAVPLAWSADGRRVYFQRFDRSLAVVRRSGATAELELPARPRTVTDLRPSPAGDRLAYHATHLVIGQPEAALFTLRTVPATGLPAAGAEPSAVARHRLGFDWSPSGDALVYTTRRSIREVAPDGTGDRELVGDDFGECDFADPRVSPDDRWILFQRCSRSGMGSIYVAHRDGSGARRIGYGGYPRWVEGGEPPKRSAAVGRPID
jgi:hypothetical protein